MRVLNHILMTPWRLRRAFSTTTLSAIEQRIKAREGEHGGEICFAVEADLHISDVIRGVTPRQRALDVFGKLRVWDTEDNNGVLIYVLLADQDVEIVADRGFNNRVGAQEWQDVCSRMEASFRARKFEQGACQGIDDVSALIAKHFPNRDRNELSDRPVLL